MKVYTIIMRDGSKQPVSKYAYELHKRNGGQVLAEKEGRREIKEFAMPAASAVLPEGEYKPDILTTKEDQKKQSKIIKKTVRKKTTKKRK